MSVRVSVIVPVLNEARRIDRQLTQLTALDGVYEVVVADGGSVDDTVEIVRRHREVRLVDAPRGRGPQMNAGARAATGDVLLFLHADVTLPDDAVPRVGAALGRPDVVAGAFHTRTVPDGATGWAARWLRLADLRSRYTRLPYGDQALFVRREAFDAVGGFPEQALFEDVEIGRRLRRVGRVATVSRDVEVSGRRFMARPVYYALLMNVLPVLYRLGVRPETLARAYGDPR